MGACSTVDEAELRRQIEAEIRAELENEANGGTIKLEAYDDARSHPSMGEEIKVLPPDSYNVKDIETYWLNEYTVFEGSEQLVAEIIEKGKNPGLGVRSLHERGITGEGVNVAIIDQHLLINHPEFDGKIIEYYDTGCETPANSGSMHGPAVTSLLVGENTGTAPGANVYYAAMPSWKQDAKYGADALEWIIERNRELPEGEKIRAVSISAALSGNPNFRNGDEWERAVVLAQAEGIMVIDCRNNSDTGFVGAGYYDLDKPDNLKRFSIGWPNQQGNVEQYASRYLIFAPTSRRSSAEEYLEGETGYQYTGQGGLSWAIPYVTGVLAMGWQVNPGLGNDEIKELLFETAYKHKSGAPVINPVAFIEAVEGTVG